MRSAVLYLRVSTTSQVKTDYDPEGISIPTQRLACLERAKRLGDDVVVLDEYVEPGRSGTQIASRPAYREMIQRIIDKRDVDLVICYNLSRLNRNRVEDALMVKTLQDYGVTLVSVMENVDGTPSGQMLHGMTAVINEYQSKINGLDIKHKMGHKARQGGTINKAPLGYLNVRETFEGREVRTVKLDPERAHLIRAAFELYATGRYSLDTLKHALTERGLLMPYNVRHGGEHPISIQQLQKLLRNRYYAGFVYVKTDDEWVPGRHEAIISLDLFERVGTVISTHYKSSERQRTHHHYLKGSLWCFRCRSRMIIQRAVGRHGGVYFYFFCIGRQHHQSCDQPYVRVERMEKAVEERYALVTLAPDMVAAATSKLREVMEAEEELTEAIRRDLTGRLRKLDAKEENLLDLAADGLIRKDKLRARLLAIQAEQEQLRIALADIDGKLAYGQETLERAVQLLGDVHRAYGMASPSIKRQMNQLIFPELFVEDGAIREVQLSEIIHDVLTDVIGLDVRRTSLPGVARGEAGVADLEERRRYYRERPGTTRRELLTAVSGTPASSSALLVELRGIEPLTYSMRTRGGEVVRSIVRRQMASEDCHGVAETAEVAVLHGCTDTQGVA